MQRRLSWLLFFLAFFFSIMLTGAPVAAGAPGPCPCSGEERLLRLTDPPMRGLDVSDLQLRLAQLGYYIGPLNGVYDGATNRAVVNFQKDRGLTPRGQVGPATWLALAQGASISSNASGKAPPEGKNLKVIVDTGRLVLTILVEGQVFRQYPVAIGKYTSPSPVGEWKIIDKAYEAGGVFGTRWMGLNVPWGNYGIHGTNRPWSIGWAASAGCFRMYNEDIEEIYPWLPVGTPVVVKGPYTQPTGPLKPGYGSPEVVTLQARLREKGFYLFGPTDGDYGLMTELAVREFQLHQGLKATGVADITTLRSLGFEVPGARP
ncbi:L,D-transpeptidase family protein [Neomoorella mulderi]|uniref:Putative L,D-transpeptidase YkuD n=1 Tax=Moorella mulderi DSM 14980 TaxID=1122241 RepID=A0A151B1W4_9FIRM|nr:peptidoglycan-binding protein [Moorella mulderi]KYH33866.1 putative L,D-transpeptidase YkuD [Moorella mulderi DSM 14980]